MSHEALYWAWRQPVSSPAQKLVLICIADAADGDGCTFPGQERLASLTGLTKRSVQRSIQHWESIGLLEVYERFDPSGRQTSSLYLLRLDRGRSLQQLQAEAALAKRRGAKSRGLAFEALELRKSRLAPVDNLVDNAVDNSGDNSGEGDTVSPPGVTHDHPVNPIQENTTSYAVQNEDTEDGIFRFEAFLETLSVVQSPSIVKQHYGLLHSSFLQRYGHATFGRPLRANPQLRDLWLKTIARLPDWQFNAAVARFHGNGQHLALELPPTPMQFFQEAMHADPTAPKATLTAAEKEIRLAAFRRQAASLGLNWSK